MRDEDTSKSQLIRELAGLRSRADDLGKRETLSLLLKANDDGIWAWKTETGEAYFSPSWYTMLGYEPDEFPPTYKNLIGLIHPDDLDKANAAILLAKQTRKPFSVEFRMKTKGGDWLWIQSRGRAFEGEGGEGHPHMVGTHTDISSRRETETYLRLTRSIIERANVGIYLVDEEGRILEINRKAEEILGYTKADLEQLTIPDIDPDITPESWPLLWNELRGEKKESLIRKHIGKDGSPVPVEIYTTHLAYEGKEFDVAFVQDITERLQKEEVIREKDILLQDIGRQAKIGAWKVDLETGRVTNTEEILRIYDLDDKEKVSIDEGLSYCTGESRIRIENAFHRAVDEGIPYDLDLEILSAKGKAKWVHTTGYPVMKQGHIMAVQGSFQDITEIKQSEMLLKKSEKKYRDLIELSPLGIGIIDPEGHIVDANQSLAVMLGYGIDELIRLSLKDICPLEGMISNQSLLETLVKGERASVSLEERFRHRAGDLIWVNIKMARTENICGPGVFLSLFCEDISMRKRMEEEREKLESQLMHSRKMEAVGQLAGGVAHDFNNMLAGIMAAAELLQQSIPNGESSAGEYLNMIVESSERASKLIAQLLAFSRKEMIQKEDIDIHKVLEETLSILNRTLDRRITIRHDFEAESAVIQGDGNSIINAILNLSINAGQAMKEKGGELTIITRNKKLGYGSGEGTMFSLKPGNYLEIEIRDTGTGIAPEIIDRIFEPFFTTKGVGKGSGLGLSAVYGTVEHHDGDITVNSKVGEGTSFHIFLPCSLPHPSPTTGR